MRPATLRELADAGGIDVPPIRGFKSFKAFAGMYDAACRVLVGESTLRRLVREVVEDAARDGVVWIEPTFYSGRYVSTFGSNEAAIEIVLDELAAAGRSTGVGTGLIVSSDRTVDPAEAVRLAKIAVSYADSAWSASVWPTTRSAGRRGRSPRPSASRSTEGSSPPPTAGSWPALSRSAAAWTTATPTASCTASGPSRTPTWWRCWPTRGSASTPAPARMCCSASFPASTPTPSPTSSPPGSDAPSTPTTLSCSDPDRRRV